MRTSSVFRGAFRWQMGDADALTWLRSLPDRSVDAVVTDPPYPEIDRRYGRLSEAAWHELMRGVVLEVRRALAPCGSAVFVLQPNSERVGRMRPWLWEFMAWTAREWGMIQDAWWWNHAAVPTVHCRRENGLMRPSVKACVWLGPYDAYRCQDAVLWSPSETAQNVDREDRALRRFPGGQHVRRGRACGVADERGGVTPFNLLPIANTDSRTSSGATGHGAGTPRTLCDWWVRYICPPGGVVADPFAGHGTVGVAALASGRRFVGTDSDPAAAAACSERLAACLRCSPCPGCAIHGPDRPHWHCRCGISLPLTDRKCSACGAGLC